MLPILAGVFGAGILVLVYASLIERRWYAVRRHTLDCLPPGSAPMRVLHLSDLHLRAVQRKKIRFLRALARFEPDIVVGTGDFLGDAEAVPATLDAVEGLRGRVASVFVLGSNDYYSPMFKNPLRYLRGPSKHTPKGRQNPWRDLTEGLRQAGWHVLSNERADADDIDIAGLDDPHIGRARIETAAAPHGRFNLAVVHSPEPVRELAGMGYDLIVTGHTHGGQLRIPGYGAVVTNTRGLPRAWVRGAHRIGDAWLHVSAGLGTSMFAPVRFACRPEVCVLELVERQPSRAR